MMKRPSLHIRILPVVLACGTLSTFAAGCPGGGSGPGVLSTSGFTSSGSAGDDDDGDDDGTTGDVGADGADDTTGEPPPEDACSLSQLDYGSYPTAVVDGDVLVLADVCDVPGLVAHEADDDLLEIHDEQNPSSLDNHNFRVVVYRPDDQGSWPDEPAHPVVFFVPGADQHLYDYEYSLIEAPDGPGDVVNIPPTDLTNHYLRLSNAYRGETPDSRSRWLV